MSARLLNLLAKLRSSMWLLPALMAFFAIALAIVVSVGESRVTVPPRVERFLFSGDAAGARAILSAIAGSMIGVTGVVFSITIVALTLASAQFGPRLLRNFMRDRVVQMVLGTFIGTFLFCLITLRSIRDTEGARGAYLAVVIAVLLAIFSIGVLIYFIHHIASSIQADTVVTRVAAELTEKLDTLYPARVGAPVMQAEDRHLPPAFETEAVAVRAPRSGYIQALDPSELLLLAKREDLMVELVLRPGHFAPKHAVLLHAWPPSRVTEGIAAQLSATVILGPRRTAEADIEFLLEQLVEIACRALSPGINDPFTAVSCVDRLGAALLDLAGREVPTRWREDDEAQLRIVANVTTFDRMMAASFDQIRQYGRSSVAVTIRLLEVLAQLAEATAHDPVRAAAVQEQADRVLRSSLLTDNEESDIRAIAARHALVRRALA